uniref:DUF4440 domain-containing protein n=1 Tax=Acrobeloides nanus TaxID=290746 RepID=A0A914CKT3_9BILA
MVLSQAQIDEIASNFHEKFVKFLALRDPLKVAACYEPNAVLIQSGQETKVWFGREQITQMLKLFLANYNPNAGDKLTQSLATPNGEYVILQGICEEGGNWKPYEVVLRKQSDGSYLITRDEFKV